MERLSSFLLCKKHVGGCVEICLGRRESSTPRGVKGRGLADQIAQRGVRAMGICVLDVPKDNGQQPINGCHIGRDLFARRRRRSSTRYRRCGERPPSPADRALPDTHCLRDVRL